MIRSKIIHKTKKFLKPQAIVGLCLAICFFSFTLIGYSTTVEKTISSEELLKGTFIENKGQILDANGKKRDDVHFMYESTELNCLFTSKKIIYKWNNSKTLNSDISMELLGANANVQIEASHEDKDYRNYIMPSSSEMISNVKSYQEIIYKNVYNKIDLIFKISSNKANHDGFKYDFIVHPGGNPNDIKLQYSGQSSIKLKRDGSITVKNKNGKLEEGIPYCYQKEGESTVEVPTSFYLEKNIIQFKTKNYDPNKDLVIDPLLSWATYYATADGGVTTVDAMGNVYLAACTDKSDLATNGTFQSTYTAPYPTRVGIVVKFNNLGERLWSTYVGGSSFLNINSIKTDVDKNIIITGETGNNPTISSSAHQASWGGGKGDAFIMKFSPAGVRLWGTFYGGSMGDVGTDLAISKNGDIYLTGTTSSSNNIASPNSFKITPASSEDVFIAKFSSQGVRLWATYYGGESREDQPSIALDSDDNVFITGSTTSTTGIAYANSSAISPLNKFGGRSYEMYVAKFSKSGSILLGFYYGGVYNDYASDIFIDHNSLIYVVGSTENETGIVKTSSGYTPEKSTLEGVDAFIAVFDNTATLQWSTYYGGSGSESADMVFVDPKGEIYVAGWTDSKTGISTPETPQPTYGGGSKDGFVLKLTYDGKKRWCTYYGGPEYDRPRGFCVADNGDFYLSGFTWSRTGITKNGYLNTIPQNGTASFLAKFGQTARAGSNTSNAINLGTISCGPDYIYTANNAPSQEFGNDNTWEYSGGQVSDDIFYKFTLNEYSQVDISTCGSNFDTYLHLLKSDLTKIQSNDDNGRLCTGNKASLTHNLAPGTYYFVVEGYSSSFGDIEVKLNTRKALLFDGVNDRVTIPTHPAINLGTGAFAIEAYIKSNRTTASGNIQVIASKRTTSSNGFMFGLWSDGRLWAQLQGAPNLAVGSGPVLTDGRCHHVVLTRASNGTVKFFVNGFEAFTTTRTADISTTGSLNVGWDAQDMFPFDGYIRDLRIWNKELDIIAVQNSINRELGVTPGLVANWPFNEGTVQSVLDKSGNNISGYIGATSSIESSDPTRACNTPCATGHVLFRQEGVEVFQPSHIDSSSFDNSQFNFKLFPNPFQDKTKFVVNGQDGILKLEILDSKGFVVYDSDYIINDEIELGKGLESGFYLLKLYTHDKVKVIKMVKQE